MSRSKVHRPGFLRRVFFLDVLMDRRTRPVLIYVALMILFGAVLFHWLEGWDWIDSFYFVVITLTTIGYGDFTPTTPLTKLITIFYGVNGVILILMLFDMVRRYRHWEIPDVDVEGDSITDQD